MWRGQQRRARSGGFTLVEVMIVVALLGMMLAVVTFTLRNVMRSDLRSAASRTAAAMRFAFDRAMMTGKYIRLVIDIEKRRLSLEVSEDRVSLRKGRKQLTKGGKGDEGDEDDDEPAEEKRPAGPRLPLGLGGGGDGSDGQGIAFGVDTEALMRGYERDLKPVKRKKARFKPLKAIGGKPLKLPTGIEVEAVVTARLDEPADKGTAYVYFFPQGNAEPAIIRLRNQAEDYYSVVLHPLTGRARVHPCRYRIPEDFGIDDVARRKGRRRDLCEGQR